jgi:hypothetical protein
VTGGGRADASSRYAAIDVLRGLALVSMISAHMNDFHLSTTVGRVLHSAHWIDGAFFFVALSGLVTGLVHRRVVERWGFQASATKLVRRAGFLYLVHLALALTIMTVYNSDPRPEILATPSWNQAGGFWLAIGKLLSLRLEPDFNSVLPMYVALLLWAVAAVALLRRGRWGAVAGISLAVYVFGQTVNGLAITPGAFAIADWQLLFTAGLFVGWTWEHERQRLTVPHRRLIIATAGAFAAAMYLLARFAEGPMEQVFGTALAKANGGWLAFLFAGAVLVTGYAGIDALRRHAVAVRVLRPIEIAGTKGLPGYAAMVLMILLIGLVPRAPHNDLVLVVIATVCGAVEYASMQLTRARRAATVVATADPGLPVEVSTSVP